MTRHPWGNPPFLVPLNGRRPKALQQTLAKLCRAAEGKHPFTYTTSYTPGADAVCVSARTPTTPPKINPGRWRYPQLLFLEPGESIELPNFSRREILKQIRRLRLVTGNSYQIHRNGVRRLS